ncbi:MAG TPA: methylmalonyl-CoA epimerase [Caldisericia bacterium]|nr:methylmalonyl-CoA epimerase [Caldisericia bacterium]HPF48131.1 methylmalonyl-CoA epimerase [Caldisericia bacterium]HPI83932.1 methylmalonyl-CoA epimerase [Caldisericia bacterium]HPQ92584.1 methylmalonyl-CoA epimerase [Caldisericia bacterium]HRV74318.1 methylmalonyl-CoA epimerase [Caldisericia bacterium]
MPGLSHIGIATNDVKEAMKSWLAIGFVLDHECEVPDQKVRVAKLKYGDLVVELLEPISEDSPIAKFIEKKGPGIHHMAIEVECVKSSIESLMEREISMIDKEPRIGAAGKPIAFIHPKSTGGVLLEMEEE